MMSTFAKGPNPGKCLLAYLLFAGHGRVPPTVISTYFRMWTDVPGLDDRSAAATQPTAQGDRADRAVGNQDIDVWAGQPPG